MKENKSVLVKYQENLKKWGGGGLVYLQWIRIPSKGRDKLQQGEQLSSIADLI